MITSLALENFKSWRNTGAITCGRLTGLFGTNSSGKTSILQMLLLLKQTASSSDRNQVLYLGDDKSMVELGTYAETIFDHNLEKELSFDIQWKLKQPLEVLDPAKEKEILFKGDTVGFSTKINWKGNGDQSRGRMFVKRLAYQFAEHEFGMRIVNDSKMDYELFPKEDGFRFIRVLGRAWPLPSPVKCYGYPDQVRAYYQNAGFLSDLELQFEQLFKNLYYLGPLREYPRRDYSWAGSPPEDMGQRGEKVIDAILASRDSGSKLNRGYKKKRQTLEQRIAECLKNLGLIHDFQIRPIREGGKLFQVWVRRTASSPEVLITDVGFGVSQILPVLTLCYYVPEGSTLLLEQPEIHLHPNVQSGLADVFIDAMKTRNVQIIIESHSEHLLRRLQRRIAEEVLNVDDTKLYFCSTMNKESRLAPLQLDVFGNITNWPENFFGDEFGEIAAMNKAAIIRRRRERSSD